MKTSFFHFVLCLIVGCLAYITSSQTVAAPLPSAEDVCGIVDYEPDNRYYARRLTSNLNVGEPRMVRMIYFLPNDRSYRADVVQRMKDEILNIQNFYAESMQAHGHDNMTFSIENDSQNDPVVHHVDGQYPDTHYIDDTANAVLDEIRQEFDVRNNIYFIVIDNRMNAIGRAGSVRAQGVGNSYGKNGGTVFIPGEFEYRTAAHELGHAFRLQHDFRHGTYIMSYGPRRNRNIGQDGKTQLSVCNAGFLAVHPYFNSNIPTESGVPPIIKLTSPTTYPADSESVSIQLTVSDSEGLYQVILFVTTIGLLGPSGFPEMKACHKLSGETESVVEFEYDGDIPSTNFTNLFGLSKHPIKIAAIDIDGEVSYKSFTLSKILPERPAPNPKTLVKISGDNQQGAAGIALTHPFVVEVKSQNDTPLSEVPVTFAVIFGDGKLNEHFTFENVVTNADGRAESILTLGTGTNIVEVSVSEGSPALFHATGIGSTAGGDYRTWGLPNGAKMRLGKGGVGEIGNAVAFSPNGQYLAVSSDIGIWLYNPTTYQEVALLYNPEKVSTIAFSPDGSTILSGVGGNASNVRSRKLNLWDVATKEKGATFGYGYGAVSFSPDGKTLASLAGTLIYLWGVETGQKLAELKHKNVRSVKFSPDGTMLVSGGEDNVVRLWNVTTEQNTATLTHKSVVHSVSFSPDGKTFVSASGDGTIKLWDIATATENVTIQVFARVVLFSPDGKTLAWLSGKRIKLWDIATQTDLVTFYDPAFIVDSVAFSLDGKTLVTGSSATGSVKVWDIETGNAIDLGHTKLGPRSFSTDSAILASGTRDGTVKLWNVTTGQNIGNLPHKHGSWIRRVAFSPDGKTLASYASGEGFTRFWDVTTQTTTAKIANKSSRWTFSPDGRTFVSISGYKIELWDVVTGTKIGVLEGHVNVINNVAFSPNGEILASASSSDGEVKLWDVLTSQNFATLDHPNNFAFISSFSPDGSILTVLVSQGIEFWDIETRTLITILKQVAPLRFSPDGRIMISTNHDHSITIWDAATRTPITTLEGGWGNAIFSPDGSMLASSYRSTILLADMDSINATLTPSAPASINQTRPITTELLPNYPNPFNPETWMPYRLAEETNVMLDIYATDGRLVRSIDVGHSRAGVYETRNKAIYWDGRNDLGESMASGVYFYHLKAGEYSATKRMVILK